ncbi:MAG: hypothetical protein AB7G47_14990 [Mycolicibacterium sp.]|uniref:hypothetical protein n=1 Tax=Mycolicibacterium sp. TaxID=2320850 RepID=UPI003D0B738D
MLDEVLRSWGNTASAITPPVAAVTSANEWVGGVERRAAAQLAFLDSMARLTP